MYPIPHLFDWTSLCIDCDLSPKLFKAVFIKNEQNAAFMLYGIMQYPMVCGFEDKWNF